ncbi:MAG: aminotransferase class III-fold pyridoxal phosphate-dependent enzyme, partial [Gemmatimonadota bacterium]
MRGTGPEDDGSRVVAIVQARCSSRRLPGKVLADVAGRPMIGRLLDQLSGVPGVDEVVVATSNDPSDDPLVAYLGSREVRVVRGPVEDVLGRFEEAVRSRRADVIVRLTGDCPLHSPDTVREVLNAFLTAGVDYACNTDPYTRPDGQDVEVFTREALERAHSETRHPADREHVTPYLRRAEGIRRLSVRHRDGSSGKGLRWTVDTPDDLTYARSVWERLDRVGPGPHDYPTILNTAKSVPRSGTDFVPNEGYYRSLFAGAPSEPAAPLQLTKSEEWLTRSEKVVPGGAQTYSKSWRQHIRGVSPVFLERGDGARVWDVDGNEYVDLIQGLLPNILGYAHPDVDRAAHDQARRGHSFSLPHPVEVELAERLVRLIPCAEMVRFGKNGSDATTAAVRVARAFTGRERIAVCGYHGWHDWYIGTTSRSLGVPRSVAALTHPFPYDDLETLDRLLASHAGEFAAVIMEPVNFAWPSDGYLEGVKEVVHSHGALLIFDEICTGFRLGPGGAQELFGVTPDLAAFGKAMGNGYPISCLAGRRDVMRILDEVFVSFTFAGNASAMAASLTVLDILEHTDALDRMRHAGQRLADGTRMLAAEAGLEGRFRVDGRPEWCLLRFLDADGADDPLLRAVWTQEVTRRGVLILATHNVSAAHDTRAVEAVLRAYAAGFKRISHLVGSRDELRSALDGPIPTAAFRARG